MKMTKSMTNSMKESLLVKFSIIKITIPKQLLLEKLEKCLGARKKINLLSG